MVLPKIGNKIPDNRKRNSVKTERGHVEANKPIKYPLPERQLR